MQDLRMGLSYYLVKDRTREMYDLGKFTGNWASLLAAPGLGRGPERGCDFTVVDDVDLLTGLLSDDWRDAGVEAPDGYLRRVAEDVARWAGSDLVRFTSDASHDGWHNPDGSHDDGRVTGSRYSEATRSGCGGGELTRRAAHAHGLPGATTTFGRHRDARVRDLDRSEKAA